MRPLRPHPTSTLTLNLRRCLAAPPVKIFYTGVLVFMDRGSPAQLTWGILSAMFYIFLCGQLQPYQDWREDFLWSVCLVSMFLTFFSGFIIKHKIEVPSGFEGKALPYMLAFNTAVPPVLARGSTPTGGETMPPTGDPGNVYSVSCRRFFTLTVCPQRFGAAQSLRWALAAQRAG